MFLGNDISALIAQIRAAYPRHFALAERLNEFMNGQLFAMTVRTNERQKLLLAALLTRLLTALQGTVLVAERGMLSEVKLLLRKVLDVTFRVIAIARDDEAARLYVLSGETQRKKFFSKYRLLSESARTPVSPEINAIEEDVKRRIQEDEIKERTTPVLRGACRSYGSLLQCICRAQRLGARKCSRSRVRL